MKKIDETANPSIACVFVEENDPVGTIQGAKQWSCQVVLPEVAEANKEGLDFFSQRGFQKIADLP